MQNGYKEGSEEGYLLRIDKKNLINSTVNQHQNEKMALFSRRTYMVELPSQI